MPIEIYSRTHDLNDVNIIPSLSGAQENEVISELNSVEIHCKELNFLLGLDIGISAGGAGSAGVAGGLSTSRSKKGQLKIGKKFLEWNYQDQIILKFFYPDITLHAIARDDAVVGSRPCIYLQLSSTCFNLNGNPSPFIPTDENGDEMIGDDDDDFLELRLVPDLTANNRGIIDDLFAALCEASALHLDEDQKDSKGDEYEILQQQNTSNSSWITRENIDSFVPSQEQQVCS